MSIVSVCGVMRISEFILRNIEALIAEWVAFARSLPPGSTMSDEALRNDAERMLRFIAADVETQQSPSQAYDKAQGRGSELPGGQTSAATDHAVHRYTDRFSLPQMVAEYRALRASVIRVWLEQEIKAPTEAMTDLVRFNEALDQSIAESINRFNANVDRDRQMFNAMLSHDMRTPLQAITVSAEFLSRSAPGDSKQKEVAARIATSGTRLSRMIGELADYALARLGGNLLSQREPCNIEAIVEEIADEVRVGAPGHTITVQTTGNCAGVWDRGRIGQMVSNLITNAVQHGYRGSAVGIELRGDDEAVNLWVRNSGTPISENERQLIFEPYRQGAEARFANRTGSLGLGLYITREIAKAHGGTVELASSDENGTVFHAWLPKNVDCGTPGGES